MEDTELFPQCSNFLGRTYYNKVTVHVFIHVQWNIEYTLETPMWMSEITWSHFWSGFRQLIPLFMADLLKCNHCLRSVCPLQIFSHFLWALAESLRHSETSKATSAAVFAVCFRCWKLNLDPSLRLSVLWNKFLTKTTPAFVCIHPSHKFDQSPHPCCWELLT